MKKETDKRYIELKQKAQRKFFVVDTTKCYIGSGLGLSFNDTNKTVSLDRYEKYNDCRLWPLRWAVLKESHKISLKTLNDILCEKSTASEVLYDE